MPVWSSALLICSATDLRSTDPLSGQRNRRHRKRHWPHAGWRCSSDCSRTCWRGPAGMTLAARWRRSSTEPIGRPGQRNSPRRLNRGLSSIRPGSMALGPSSISAYLQPASLMRAMTCGRRSRRARGAVPRAAGQSGLVTTASGSQGSPPRTPKSGWSDTRRAPAATLLPATSHLPTTLPQMMHTGCIRGVTPGPC